LALTAKLTSVVAELNDNGGQRRISVELDVPAERQRSTSHAIQQDLRRRFWRLDDGQLDVGRVAAERVLCSADVQSTVLAPSSVDRQPQPHHRLQRPRCGCSCRRLEVESFQPVLRISNHATYCCACNTLTQRIHNISSLMHVFLAVIYTL